jgi:hypothetical protein
MAHRASLPANVKDLHQKLTAADDLNQILALREERTVTQNLTLHRQERDR